MALVTGVALRTGLVSLSSLVLVTGLANRESTLEACGERVAIVPEPDLVAADTAQSGVCSAFLHLGLSPNAENMKRMKPFMERKKMNKPLDGYA